MRELRTGPSYSIASCVIETAYRLIATPGETGDARAQRRAGRALLTAEVQGFGPIVGDTPKRRYGQGLEVTLGFYDERELVATKKVLDLVADELGESIGGWGPAIQIGLAMLSEGEGWLGSAFEWPRAAPYEHLDVLLDPFDVPQGRNAGELRIIGRRLRYRLGIDHADGSTDLFWWTTPHTEYWIDRYLSDDRAVALDHWQRPDWGSRRRFNAHVGALFRARNAEVSTNVDATANFSDDWGYVDLERDPIRVLTIGPSSGGQTRADVKMTLRRAGSQLEVAHEKAGSEAGRPPGVPQAEALDDLARANDPRCDVVLVYRGGFSREQPPSRDTCADIVRAAEQLASKGVEVVMGLGHGTTYVHGTAHRASAIGVYEAVTPTAAANWILTEHVNLRLMNSVPDPGQAG